MFKEIPIAHTISSSETDFPIYVKPSAINGWGSITTAEAESIRIYADEAKTTELPREVVSSDEIHVKKGTLANGDSIYVDYDGVRSDYAVTDTFGAQNVWNTNYKGRFGMGESSGTTLNDSTSNNNDGTFGGDLPTQIAGQVGNAQDFVDTSPADDIVTSNDVAWTYLTVSAWLNFDETGREQRFVNKVRDPGDSGDDYEFEWGISAGGPNMIVQTRESDGSSHNTTYAMSNFSTGTWYYVVAQIDDSNDDIFLYVDGSQVASNTTSTFTSVDTAEPFIMGQSQADSFYYNGQMDEVRIHTGGSSLLSSNWISIEYANQNDPATFFGTATDVSTGKRRAGFNVFF